MKVEISETTREALRNLFKILDIEGRNLDERIFRLAEMAFMGRAMVDSNKQTLIEYAGRGEGMQPRTKIEIKKDTARRLKEQFHRMYPFLEWQSWNWWLAEMMEFIDDRLRDLEAEEGLYKRTAKDNKHGNDG
jgi:hypothetical protein